MITLTRESNRSDQYKTVKCFKFYYSDGFTEGLIGGLDAQPLHNDVCLPSIRGRPAGG